MARSLPLFLAALLAPNFAYKLPRCTVAVAGANGRVGSMVVRELLRNHPQVTVRALVRSAADPWEGYGRLSYEVGAEDGKMELAPAWRMNEESGRFAAPASIEFDESVQAGYGLERLELRECELRYRKDVEAALGDADAVVWCATAFNNFRQRLPDRVDEAAGKVARSGMAFFELRFGEALFGKPPREDGSDAERASEARDKTADVEGLQLAVEVLRQSRERQRSIAALTGRSEDDANKLKVPLVVASASAALGYDEDSLSGDLNENEFGYRKRVGEEVVRASGVPFSIVRSAVIDDGRTEEGLAAQVEEEADTKLELAKAAGEEVGEGSVGVRQDEAKRRRIHPRDLASYLVASLARSAEGDEAADATAGAPAGGTVEVWTAMQNSRLGMATPCS